MELISSLSLSDAGAPSDNDKTILVTGTYSLYCFLCIINNYFFFNIYFNIFLGATGFVGAHLVQQLLKTKTDSRVICLVRNTSQFTSAEERLKHVLQRFQIWQDVESEASRLSVIEGDFGKEFFGLDKKEYSKLLDTVGTFFIFIVSFCYFVFLIFNILYYRCCIP